MRGHSKTIAPSSVPAMLQCAHFIPNENESDNDDAQLGELMHQATSEIVEHGETEVNLNDYYLSKCSEAARSMKHVFRLKFGKVEEWHIEEKVDIYFDNKLYTFGYKDLHASCERSIVGLDWKACLDGDFNKQDYKGQQAFYALGMMQKLRVSKIPWFEWYILPNHFKFYYLDYGYCSALLKHMIYRKNNPEKFEKHINYNCRYCAKIGMCDEFIKGVEYFDYKALPEHCDNPSQSWSPQNFASALDLTRLVLVPYMKNIDETIAKIKQEALEKMKFGVIPGYEKFIKTDKKLSDINAVFEQLGDIMSDEDIMEALSISISKLITQLHKTEKEKNTKFTREVAESTILNSLYGYIEYIRTEQIRRKRG